MAAREGYRRSSTWGIAALLVAPLGAVWAQDGRAPQLSQEPFRLVDEIQDGEVWTTRTETAKRVRDLVEDERELLETSTWREEARVHRLSDAWRMESTLTSLRMERRQPHAQATRSYEEADLEEILDAEGYRRSFARTWTYRFDRTWQLQEVEGPGRTAEQLFDYLRHRLDERGGLADWVGEPLVRLVQGAVTRDDAQGLRDAIVAQTNRLLAPVQRVVEHLQAGALDPGAELALEEWGVVRYLGRTERGGQFEAVRDPEAGGPAVSYRFVLDGAGRLVRLEASRTERREVRGETAEVTRSLTYVLEEVAQTTG